MGFSKRVRRELVGLVTQALLQLLAGTLFLAPRLGQLSGLRDVSAQQLVLRQERASDVFECMHGVLFVGAGSPAARGTKTRRLGLASRRSWS